MVLGSYSDQFIEEVYVPLKPRVTLEIKRSCILYAKWYLDRSNESWGNAGQLEATSEKPYLGGLVLTEEGEFGHVAVITGITKTHILITEANYFPGQVSTRSISLDNPLIRGYR